MEPNPLRRALHKPDLHMSEHHRDFQQISHNVDLLMNRALAYFDKDLSQYNFTQINSARKIEAFFDKGDVRADIEAVPESDMSNIISLIGNIFFAGHTNDVRFIWYTGQPDIPIDADTIACTKTIDERVCIIINTRNHIWQGLPQQRRWHMARDLLFHESIHAFFEPFELAAHLRQHGGHHAPWHMVAKAMERRSISVMGMNLALNRNGAFILEHEDWGTVHMSAGQRRTAFRNQFTYGSGPQGQSILLMNGIQVVPKTNDGTRQQNEEWRLRQDKWNDYSLAGV